ncbi:MAG: MATE family efflux transporter [Eubacteriales bacterium]|nr:MATE family efflux transporter [Clostridiales bacterium]MDD7773993.1 MATE family efflux transporter [Eubacteriales bacterium]MDY3940779.1 MATE family efflux transporter [Eubacteriales bacterium]
MEENKLLTEKTGRLLLRYGLPCVISLLVGALYNIVDQIFIANASYLGSYGNAANSVVFPLTVIALAIATMIGDGCCAFVSIRLGAKKDTEAKRGVGTSILWILCASVVLTALYLCFAEPILTAFGARVNDETFALSKEYFFWISLGIPFYMFGQGLNPIIRSDGNPRFAMVSLLAGALTNCVLDPIFIYPLRMGMKGAAIATVIGQIVSAVCTLWYLTRMQTTPLERGAFTFFHGGIGQIASLGMTSFLSQVSIVLSMAAVLNMCQKYGALDPIFSLPEYAQIPTAVVGIVMKFFQIVMSIAIGLSAGAIPIVGYNIGAGRRDRASRLMVELLCTEFAIGLCATILFDCFPHQLIAIFGAKNESVYYTDFAILCIRLFLSTTALACVNKGTFIFLQSLGKAWTSAGLSMLREVGFGVGLVLLFPLWFGLYGMLWFMAAADILTFILCVFVILRVRRELQSA